MHDTSLEVKKVTYYVWFHVTLHFCLRGSELQSKLKRTHLESTTIAGTKDIFFGLDFKSKNHQGGSSGSVSETAGALTDPEQIFVVHRYLSKLNPKHNRLFQRACYGATVLQQDRDVWFMNAALGHNMLAKFMRELSVAANLSTTYTNHCVRVTTIVNLKSAGFDDRKICAVSGHKNVPITECLRPSDT